MILLGTLRNSLMALLVVLEVLDSNYWHDNFDECTDHFTKGAVWTQGE
jgi:hypothetical protein